MDPFIRLLEEASGTIALVVHKNADPDALCSAAALQEYLHTELQLQSKIYADGLNTTASKILTAMDLEVVDELPIEDPNIVVTLDTSNFSQLGKYQHWVKMTAARRVVIDHHNTGEILENAFVTIADSDAPSTCMVLSRFFRIARHEPSATIATLLLSGHIYDSRRFFYGSTEEVFENCLWLMQLGGDIDKANEFLQTEMDISERMARMKAFQRVSIIQLGKMLIVTSNVASFEASVARQLINSGADIALVCAIRKDIFRASARVANYLDIPVGDILEQVSKEFGGSGGGHDAAAGCNIGGGLSHQQAKDFTKRFVDVLQSWLPNQETS